MEAFLPFTRELAHRGMRNSLAQLALKLTLPGVPDIYQGTEFWDFSLVDPDNRRPVDYGLRDAALRQSPDWQELMTHWQDGRIKQRLLATLLRHRQDNRALYAYGSYEALPAGEGEAVAYMRRLGTRCCIIAVQRSGEPPECPLALPFPARDVASAHDVLTGESIRMDGSLTLPFPDGLPVALYDIHLRAAHTEAPKLLHDAC